MFRNAIFLVLALAGTAHAKNVDLTTLPQRTTVQLTIYNSADITLVKETRSITLKKGLNQLQFSWANTLIDPSSVEFRPLEHADEIEVLDTMFPGQKPQHLVWNIDSAYEGQARVEVSYFTSGLTWQMDYVGTTDPDEERMDLNGYVRVFNRSGEDYEHASVRLIVGKINLVEKIRDLAVRRGIPVPQPGTALGKEMKRRSAKTAFARAEDARHLDMVEGEKGIVKEGLSEYFMFTVKGQETIKNGWSKRMRAVESRAMKFSIVYRLREHQYGPRPVRFFLWSNDTKSGLGDSPLPDGRIRLFRQNGKDGVSYLGDQLLRYVPIKAKIEINLGPDDLVVYERRKSGTERYNFKFHQNGRREHVVGWDERQQWIDTLRNYRKKPIRFEIHRQWPGDVEFETEDATKLFDFQTVDAGFDLPARNRKLFAMTVVTHQGTNRKQNRIRLR